MIQNTLHTEKALNCDKNNFLKGCDKELKKLDFKLRFAFES